MYDFLCSWLVGSELLIGAWGSSVSEIDLELLWYNMIVSLTQCNDNKGLEKSHFYWENKNHSTGQSIFFIKWPHPWKGGVLSCNQYTLEMMVSSLQFRMCSFQQINRIKRVQMFLFINQTVCIKKKKALSKKIKSKHFTAKEIAWVLFDLV